MDLHPEDLLHPVEPPTRRDESVDAVQGVLEDVVEVQQQRVPEVEAEEVGEYPDPHLRLVHPDPRRGPRDPVVRPRRESGVRKRGRVGGRGSKSRSE